MELWHRIYLKVLYQLAVFLGLGYEDVTERILRRAC